MISAIPTITSGNGKDSVQEHELQRRLASDVFRPLYCDAPQADSDLLTRSMPSKVFTFGKVPTVTLTRWTCKLWTPDFQFMANITCYLYARSDHQ